MPTGDAIRLLARRVISPMCGLVPNLGLTIRQRHGTRVVTAAAELTGVHHLVGSRPVDPGAHHIGAASPDFGDATIRCLAESIERYAPFAFTAHHKPHFTFTSWHDLHERGAPIPSQVQLTFFDDEQLATPGFPFERFDADAPLSWWPMASLTGSDDMLVPAQLTLTGYQPRRADGEKRSQTTVSTGTAAHTDPGKALLNAIQELVQLDSVIGHWHSATPSVRIIGDRRTRTLQRLIDTYWDTHAPYPEFHLLPSPDLPSFTIACLIRGREGHHSAIAVGLGADTKLTLAMYKALLEATTLANSLSWKPLTDHKREGQAFYDLDSNVDHYADPTNAHIVEDKFARCTAINAADLEPDFTANTRSTVRHFVNAFRATGKQLLYANLTTPDIHQLGFHVLRVWSPHTLNLTLPSAPARQHRRFHDYGGYQNNHPHPYP